MIVAIFDIGNENEEMIYMILRHIFIMSHRKGSIFKIIDILFEIDNLRHTNCTVYLGSLIQYVKYFGILHCVCDIRFLGLLSCMSVGIFSMISKCSFVYLMARVLFFRIVYMSLLMSTVQSTCHHYGFVRGLDYQEKTCQNWSKCISHPAPGHFNRCICKLRNLELFVAGTSRFLPLRAAKMQRSVSLMLRVPPNCFQNWM